MLFSKKALQNAVEFCYDRLIVSLQAESIEGDGFYGKRTDGFY